MFLSSKGGSKWVSHGHIHRERLLITVATKSLEIAAAEYGLGAFAMENIKKGEYIGGNVLPCEQFIAERSTPFQNMWGRFTTTTITRRDRTPQISSRN